MSNIINNILREAERFLVNNQLAYSRVFKSNFVNPKVFVFEDGVVDLHWKYYDKELLIHFSEDDITFYGDKRKNENIVQSAKGELRNKEVLWLFIWLMQE